MWSDAPESTYQWLSWSFTSAPSKRFIMNIPASEGLTSVELAFFLDLQTLAICPILPQLWQTTPLCGICGAGLRPLNPFLLKVWDPAPLMLVINRLCSLVVGVFAL